jgi:urease accessory protein
VKTPAEPDRVGFLRLLQLASPALPVGAFAYSQGLEAAVAAGFVNDEESTARWILGVLAHCLVWQELPIFERLHAAAGAGDAAAVRRWNDLLFATRATAELQAEERHLGAALARVLGTLGIASPFDRVADSSDPRPWRSIPTFAALFAVASAAWHIDGRTAMEAFAFTWSESQTSAAVRLIPLGQSAGVRVLARAADAIPHAVQVALSVREEDLGAAAPGQALLSTGHETQYSRLFRS